MACQSWKNAEAGGAVVGTVKAAGDVGAMLGLWNGVVVSADGSTRWRLVSQQQGPQHA